MATTDYLQRIRATQRYQDLIAAHALLELIQRVTLGRRCCSIRLDWLKYRLSVDIFDLTRWRWGTKSVQVLGDRDGVINIKSVHAITPGQRSLLIDLVRCLRRLADFKNVFSLPYQVSIRTLRKISLLLTPFLGACQISRAQSPGPCQRFGGFRSQVSGRIYGCDTDPQSRGPISRKTRLSPTTCTRHALRRILCQRYWKSLRNLLVQAATFTCCFG